MQVGKLTITELPLASLIGAPSLLSGDINSNTESVPGSLLTNELSQHPDAL